MIHNAKIINNKPCCGNCGSDNISGIREYKSIVMGGNTYTMFQVKCYDCKEDNRYLADVKINGTTRCEISSEIKIIE